ncbi:hypothetical protein [Micromonospora sp. 067-2]|uniref:hypothetical protein n=1 Tax=Micromonospora sp. 067-2 TaxID=2789270 RepID=UPI003979E820
MVNDQVGLAGIDADAASETRPQALSGVQQHRDLGSVGQVAKQPSSVRSSPASVRWTSKLRP